MSAKRENSRSADLRVKYSLFQNDWGFNHPLLTLCDFNSELRGCYKQQGIMRLQSGKAPGSLTSIQKEEILN